jgi:hypothetical protein
MKQIKIVIAPDGSPTVEALGFGNSSCKAATKTIEDALGKVESQVLKPEAHVPATVGNINYNTNGH